MDDPTRKTEPGSPESVGTDPRNDGYMLVGLGNAYVQRNQIPQAKVTFEQVLERFPDTEPAQLARDNLEKITSEPPVSGNLEP